MWYAEKLSRLPTIKNNTDIIGYFLVFNKRASRSLDCSSQRLALMRSTVD